MYIPMGGSKLKPANVWVILVFVALWHELDPRLLVWAWISLLFAGPEMFAKWIARCPAVRPWRDSWQVRSANSTLGQRYAQRCPPDTRSLRAPDVCTTQAAACASGTPFMGTCRWLSESALRTPDLHRCAPAKGRDVKPVRAREQSEARTPRRSILWHPQFSDHVLCAPASTWHGWARRRAKENCACGSVDLIPIGALDLSFLLQTSSKCQARMPPVSR